MLKNNTNIITFKDVFNGLGNNYKENLIELINSINNDYIKSKISIKEEKEENIFNYNIANLNNNEITYIKNYINLCLNNCNDIKDASFVRQYIDKVFKFKIKNNNEDFPFLYLLLLLKLYSDDYKSLYIFMNNIGIYYDIIKLIFFDIEVYDIYIDESGNIDYDKEEKKLFVVGGYYTKNIRYDDWEKETKAELKRLSEKYSIDDNIIYHRTKIEDFNVRKSITKEIFNFIKENKGKFVCIYENKPNGIEFTKQYYLDLVSKLIVNTLKKILSDEELDFDSKKILLIIHIAKRGDKDNNALDIYNFGGVKKFLNYIVDNKIEIDKIVEEWESHNEEYFQEVTNVPKSDIKSKVYESIEEWKIKYSVTDKNINYELSNPSDALKDSTLVFADYFCNTFYNRSGSDSKEIFKDFDIYLQIKYSFLDKDTIDFYFYKYDYYTILNRYIFYKKLINQENITKRTKDFAENGSKEILQFFKKDNLKRRVNYLVHAVKSILDNLEIESNNEFKYDNILGSCDILIDLLEKIKQDNSNDFVLRKIYSMIFMINTAKLSVYNHSDNTEKSLEMVKTNIDYINNIDNDNFFFREKILFDNISTVAQWDFYECDYIIKYIKKVLEDIKCYEKLYIDDIARLYGTLGQTYIIHYYVTENTKDLDKAKECFFESKKLFKDDKGNTSRTYSNLMLYAITSGMEDEFLDYLYKYITEKEESFDNIDLLIEKLVSYIDNNNQPDKSDKYLIIRLLRYCKNFDTEYSKKIANILIEKSSNFYDDKKRKESSEDVDIEKDYCFVYYKIKKEKISLSNSYIFVENLQGYFQYMRKLSLYLTEILTGDESYFDKAVDILEEMVNMQDTNYKKAFGKFFEESAKPNLDKYKWAYNLSKKLYM
ncbi:hypothetical protein BRSU_0224 [Brachyspira suanatina]|uniref:DUF3800 domain-containing protein n=1 Tax=Brachyspira suanatina TaxID=381802 RepID=A0A0G4K3K1_9SPIR|nr:hypothetical protein [Brachyspira suanatina]CRF31556.1 hypothetical protein BRSU_0224 [Brachyspira suanatina]